MMTTEITKEVLTIDGVTILCWSFLAGLGFHLGKGFVAWLAQFWRDLP